MTNNGGLPNGWESVRLEDCVDILDKERIPINSRERAERIADKPQSSLYPYYGATGQIGWIDDYIFDEELVLLGEDGAPFLDPYKDKSYIIRGKSWVNNHAHVLRAKQGILLNLFLKHYLDTVDYHPFVTGTTRLKLNQSRMRKITILIPPLPEQKRIIEKIEELFTQLDAGVAELQTAKAQLQRYRQAVLKSAVEGELTREWRVEHKDELEPADVLLERILSERRAKWEKEGGKGKYKEPAPPETYDLPELPVGWVWANVEQVSIVNLGRQRSPKNHTGPFMRPYLRAANITWDGLDLSDVMEMNFSPNELETYRLEVGDVIVNEASGSRSEVGKPAIWKGQISNCCFQNTVIRVRSQGPLPEYLYFHFLFYAMTGRFGNIAKGVGIHHLGATRLSNTPIKLPPLKEQKRIVERVERRLSVADEIERQLDQSLVLAERLRQSVLKRAFEGKLVAQNPDDEPASELLKRNRFIRNRNQNQLRMQGLDI